MKRRMGSTQRHNARGANDRWWIGIVVTHLSQRDGSRKQDALQFLSVSYAALLIPYHGTAGTVRAMAGVTDDELLELSLKYRAAYTAPMLASVKRSL